MRFRYLVSAFLTPLILIVSCSPTFSYTIKDSNQAKIVLETNWATQNKFDYKLVEVNLPTPKLHQVTINSQKISISGVATPARFQQLELQALVKCNKALECLKIANNDKRDSVIIHKYIRIEYVAINLGKGNGNEVFADIGRFWHDSQTPAFIGVVKKFDDKIFVSPEKGEYRIRVNIFTDFDLLEAQIPKLDLRQACNKGIYGPWSDSIQL